MVVLVLFCKFILPVCGVLDQSCCCCRLPTPMTLESGLLACGPPASLSVHLASSAVTPAGSVHKYTSDNVVRMWLQLKRRCVFCVCECYKGGIVVMDVSWR